MTSLWTLVLIWNLGSRTGQNVVIPGFSSQATCMAAVEQITAPSVRRWYGWREAPRYVVCVEVK